jgi:NADH-quinone oxidoreductase subunit L
VNHASGTFDMRRMGGLRRIMPWTFVTFVIASLSLAGIFPLSGFWSKDEILSAAWADQRLLFWVALIVVFMTAFYMGRVIFLTFGGEYKGGEAADGRSAHGAQPHESPPVMVLPLVVLAVAAVFTGFLNLHHGVTDLLEGWLPAEALARATEIEFHFGLATLSMIFGVAGFVVAWAIYSARLLSADRLRRAFGPIHVLLENKYYMDWLYQDMLVRRVVLRTVSGGLELFDRYVVDGVVNGIAWLTRFSASRLRLLQAGQLQLYAAAIFVGVVLIVAGILIVNP